MFHLAWMSSALVLSSDCGSPNREVVASVVPPVATPVSPPVSPPYKSCLPLGVQIPAGRVRLWMEDSGASFTNPDSWLTIVTVSPFCIDRTEVTRGEFLQCVQARRCRNPPSERAELPLDEQGFSFCRAELDPPTELDHPVVCVNFMEASAFCGWRGGRLPNDVEWYQAARGVAGFDPVRVDDISLSGRSVAGDFEENWRTSPVGVHPDDVSDFGVLDMLGNVSEWAESSSYPNGKKRQAGWFLVRSSGGKRLYTRPSPGLLPVDRLPNLGFRCAYPI